MKNEPQKMKKVGLTSAEWLGKQGHRLIRSRLSQSLCLLMSRAVFHTVFTEFCLTIQCVILIFKPANLQTLRESFFAHSRDAISSFSWLSTNQPYICPIHIFLPFPYLSFYFTSFPVRVEILLPLIAQYESRKLFWIHFYFCF